MIIIGTSTAKNANKEPNNTTADAAGRFSFFDNRLTSGFKEQEITYDAKNKIAMSFIFVKNIKKKNSYNKKDCIFYRNIFFK